MGCCISEEAPAGREQMLRPFSRLLRQPRLGPNGQEAFSATSSPPPGEAWQGLCFTPSSEPHGSRTPSPA